MGLGNIGPYAAMPVMEGKAALFKEFGNVNGAGSAGVAITKLLLRKWSHP